MDFGARAFLLFALLGALPLSAADVLTAGPRTFVGEPEIVPWNATLYHNAVMATDGDEVLVVWAANRYNTGGSLYALRLDRDGRPLTRQPTLLVEGRPGSGVNSNGSTLCVVWTDGLFAIFYGDDRSRLNAVRVTRELEIIDTRTFGMSMSQHFDVTRSGSEIIVVGATVVLRLGLDLTIRESRSWSPSSDPWWTPRSVADSPRGPVVVTGGTPVLTARYLDAPEGDVRIGSVTDFHASSQIEWTGSEFVVVWADCGPSWICRVQMARLDADLRVLASRELGTVGCYGCRDRVALTPLGDDDVLITWRTDGYSSVQRFRKGVALDPKPIRLAKQTVVVRTSQGRLLAVDGQLLAGELPPAGGDATSFSATPIVETAAAQRPLAVGRSATEIAIAWTGAQKTVATILTVDGTPSRTARLRDSWKAAISSDGHDLYALTSDFWHSYFQKLSDGREAVRIDALPRVFEWVGTGFLIIQPGRYDYEREEELPPQLALLDRAGRLREGCRVSPELDSDFEAIVRGGRENLALGRGKVMRIRGGCPGPVESAPLIPREPRVAWHDGNWASLFTDDEFRLKIAVAREGGRFIANPRPLFETLSQHSVAAVAGAGGRWIVLSKTGGTEETDELHAAVLDASGNVLSRTVLGTNVNGAPYLVPLSDTQLLAVYAELDFAPPWLGEQRLVARMLTIENVSRRRGVRH